MRRSDFVYELPETLIAQAPAERRSASRLLHLGSNGLCTDRQVQELPTLLDPGDLLVFNDTRVIPARLHGEKASGGRVEILVERIVDHTRLWAQIRASKAPRPGTVIGIPGEPETLRVESRAADLFELSIQGGAAAADFVDRVGRLPLPPYIHHLAGPGDVERYQTVFARAPGAVAAPTAGLHFDLPLLAELTRRGVGQAMLTLHVGAGTFQPLRVERIEDHHMHSERYEIPQQLPERVARTRAGGHRIVAVGTTVARALESAWEPGYGLRAGAAETTLFITPGYRFQAIDSLLTNFHLPGSTLLMMVASFAGYRPTMAAYRHAVAQGYRFFSYGDAMLIDTPR
jgi:S-adenosylmethionine:tRNA ribosyltransferase-isomerase